MRARYLFVGAVAGLGVTLWLSAVTPSVGLTELASGATTVVQAVAVVATVLVAMLAVVTGTLIASDWQTEAQSRLEWAQLGSTLAELSLPVAPRSMDDIDRNYLPAADDETLRSIFSAHRFLRPEPAAGMAPPVARSARRPEHARPFPTRVACEAAHASRSDGGSDAGARLKAGTQATTAASKATRPAENLTIVVREAARGSCAVSDARVRLVVNGGWAWSTSDWAGTGPAAPSRAAEVDVLTNGGYVRAPKSPDIAETNSVTHTPPSCRGPPSLEPRRSARRAATSAGDPVVLDDLGRPVPVGSAEVNVIEMYLGDVLDEVLAPSNTRSEPDRS